MTDSARLIAHTGAILVTRDELKNYPAPEPTETWKPVSHLQLVETLAGVANDRGLHIEREQFAVQGARLFGTFDLTWMKMEEYGAAVCFRHANDRTMPITIGIGNRCFICDNLAMHAELITVRRHTSKLDLGEEMDRAMYRYMQGYRRFLDDIQILHDTPLEDRRVKQLIYDIFASQIVPVRLFPLVSKLFTNVRLENQVPVTAWWLLNAFTAQIKKLAPAPAFKATARLGKFMASKF
jgi:hypothetical protein